MGLKPTLGMLTDGIESQSTSSLMHEPAVGAMTRSRGRWTGAFA